MRYVKITWSHDFLDQPEKIYLSIKSNNLISQKIEIFRGGKRIYYSENDINRLFDIEPFPSVDEYNRLNDEYSTPDDKDSLYACEITENEFHNEWRK